MIHVAIWHRQNGRGSNKTSGFGKAEPSPAWIPANPATENHMLLFDAHLDIAFNAVDWNRDTAHGSRCPPRSRCREPSGTSLGTRGFPKVRLRPDPASLVRLGSADLRKITMLLFDAHLDIAFNAVDWNRDLRMDLADIREVGAASRAAPAWAHEALSNNLEAHLTLQAWSASAPRTYGKHDAPLRRPSRHRLQRRRLESRSAHGPRRHPRSRCREPSGTSLGTRSACERSQAP